MGELENLVRLISERNKRDRDEAARLSAQLSSIVISGSQEELDAFSAKLESRFDELLEPPKDPGLGGVVGGATPAEADSGESTQQ